MPVKIRRFSASATRACARGASALGHWYRRRGIAPADPAAAALASQRAYGRMCRRHAGHGVTVEPGRSQCPAMTGHSEVGVRRLRTVTCGRQPSLSSLPSLSPWRIRPHRCEDSVERRCCGTGAMGVVPTVQSSATEGLPRVPALASLPGGRPPGKIRVLGYLLAAAMAAGRGPWLPAEQSSSSKKHIGTTARVSAI